MGNNAESQFIEGQYKIAFFLQDNPGYLRISGNDRHAFLQRQSTNDIDLLSPEQSLVTVLTSPTGRILDILWALDEGEAIGVLTLPGQGDQTFDFLQSRIFFMDQVALTNASLETCQIDLLGTRIYEFLQEFGLNLRPEKDITQSIKFGQVSARILYHPHIGLRLLIPKAICQTVVSTLRANGGVQLSAEDYEILRIESGLPAAKHELTEDYTPLENGYQWAISDNKGCYTGQEVIARQVNYDKITRHLVGLSMNNVPAVGDGLYPIDKEQPVGKITSTVLSPRFGPIALAIVKRPFDQPGNELVVHNKDQNIRGVTASLPFQ